jgi:transcription elongation factor GreB
MGRWRPRRPRSSPYITPEGARRLDRELKDLWRNQRPEVVRALGAAAAEGDRSENAEYIYRKKQLGEIDRRIRYLSKRLDEIKVIDRLPGNTDQVRFGAWVKIQGSSGEHLYRIVGADETNARKGWISVDSPVARALLGKSVGDVVTVELPEGRDALEIQVVSYQAPVA